MRSKTLWLSLMVLLLGGTCSATVRQQVHVDARLDAANYLIEGRVEARLVSDSAPFGDLRFLLYPNMLSDSPSTGGIMVDSISINGIDFTSGMSIDTTDLHVVLPADWRQTDTTIAVLWFRSRIPNVPSIFGYDDKQFLLVGWYPTPAPLRDGRWLRHHYRWFLEPASDPVDLSGVVRYPDSLQLIAGGVERIDTSGDTAIATLQLEGAVGMPLFLGTEYEAFPFDNVNYVLTIYARPDQGYLVDSLRGVITETVRWMSDYVLPYPYDELIVVVGGYTEGGALEQPRMVLMPRHRPALTTSYQETLIHEVVHQWFYATVCNNTATDPWMDEAVTEYFAARINRELVGHHADLLNQLGVTAGSTLYMRMSGYEYLPYLPLTYPGERFFNTRQCYATIYSKGPLVIKTLGALMGPEREQAFWQSYATAFSFDVPTADDFASMADRFLPTGPGSTRKILDCVNAVDFQVIALENKLAESGGETAAQADSAAANAIGDTVPGLPYDIEVVYRCVQPLGFPVDLRVTFYDGSVVDTVVDGEVGTFSWKLSAATAARSAAIDPDLKYAIDMNYLNNSLTLDESRGVGLRLFSGLAFLVESLFSGIWGY